MSVPKRKRLGRPPKGSHKVKGIRFDMRLEAAEKEAFRNAAELSGLDLSAWVRERLRAVARKELEVAGHPVAFLNRAETTRLKAAHFTRPASLQLTFADGLEATIPVARLGMPVDRIKWRTVRVTDGGRAMTVTAIKGEAVPVASATLRCLADEDYATKVKGKLNDLLSVLDGLTGEGETPAGLFDQPARDPVLPSWK